MHKHNIIQIGDELYPAIKFGEENYNFDIEKGKCHDCGVALGEFHFSRCDMEECPGCGRQLISCDCKNVSYVLIDIENK